MQKDINTELNTELDAHHQLKHKVLSNRVSAHELRSERGSRVVLEIAMESMIAVRQTIEVLDQRIARLTQAMQKRKRQLASAGGLSISDRRREEEEIIKLGEALKVALTFRVIRGRELLALEGGLSSVNSFKDASNEIWEGLA